MEIYPAFRRPPGSRRFPRHFLRRLLAGDREEHFLLALDALASALGGFLATGLLLGAYAAAQRIHEIDDLGRLAALARRFDLDALHLLLDQLLSAVS